MATEHITRLVDDLDGEDADETIRFGLDGRDYEIDLSGEHASELRTALDRFIAAATKTGRSGMVKPARRRNRTDDADNAEKRDRIRAWANRKGLQVAPRGRIAQQLIDEYHADQNRDQRAAVEVPQAAIAAPVRTRATPPPVVFGDAPPAPEAPVVVTTRRRSAKTAATSG